jgi:pentatricopeptide repeat protein
MAARDVVSWNTMLTTYVRAADVVERRSCSQQCRPVKNVIPWTTMIRALSNAGDFTATRALFNRMPERNLVSWKAGTGSSRVTLGTEDSGRRSKCSLDAA